MNLSKAFPFLDWLVHYDKKNLQGDLSAGLTVGVMLIPQGMAYAMIAGLPPIYGLYASTIPILVYALLGTSRQLAVGPVAMVSLLTAAGIGSMAAGGTESYLLLAFTLAFLVGAFQYLLGVFRLGFLVNFLSHPVISGFTSASALIIGLSQLKHLMGVKLPESHFIHEVLWGAILQVGQTHTITLIIGLAGIGLIMGMKKWLPVIPGSLLAVAFGILAVWAFGLDANGVKIVGEVPSGLPTFGLPDFSWNTIQNLAPTALAIALVSFMESIAVAKAIQAKHKNYKVVANQELVALGMANLAGSFFQAYPTTGGFSRTAVNDQAGAKTGLASIISVALIVLTLLFLTPVFYFLPKAILASVIMVAVFGLIDIKEVKHLWHANRTDFWMLAATFAATLSLGIEQGIGIGVLLSLGMVIFKTTKPHFARLGRVPGTHLYRNIERFEKIEERPDLLIVRFDAQLYFANVNYFRERLEEWIDEKGQVLKALIINAESINSLDSSALHALQDVLDDCKRRNLKFYLCTVKGPVRDALVRGHLLEAIGSENCFLTIQDAVNHYDGKQSATSAAVLQEYVLQTNEE